MRLTKETFAKAVIIINATLKDQFKLSEDQELEIVYNEVKDIGDDIFLSGVKRMLASEDIYLFPSIYKLRKYAEKEYFKNKSKEEIITLAEVRELTGIPLSDPYLDSIIVKLNVKESSVEKLIWNKVKRLK